MLTALEHFGGSKTIVLDSASPDHFLLPTERWQFIVPSGASGTATLKLPYAKGLRLGMKWYLMFDAGGSVDIEIVNWSDVAQTIYDKNGAAKTLIDISDSAAWGVTAAVTLHLLANTTDDGVWTIYYWGFA